MRFAKWAFVCLIPALSSASPRFHLGVDVDNWSGQTRDSRFERSLQSLKVDFLSWHISPQEESNPQRLDEIVTLCRRNHWAYLFNTEIANYVVDEPAFRHSDGTYRYDLLPSTLLTLKDDPLFLGVVYDEAELMQAMLGVKDGKGREFPPYFVDTRKMTPDQAFAAVTSKVGELTRNNAAYGKRTIFEMVFPDYPFTMARSGAIVAPKLLKENYNDLMYSVFRGAALEYRSKELWACVDLWFLQNFPLEGKVAQGFHTPDELLLSLQYAYSAGFDYVYVERFQALTTNTFQLTDYGYKLLEFQHWRASHKQGNWRTAPVAEYIKRFPDGYWGQHHSPFFPDHPYGSWAGNTYRSLDDSWLQALSELSKGVIPPDANNWNAIRSEYFRNHPYQAFAGLPNVVVFDQFGVIPKKTKAKVLDLTRKQ